MSLEKMLKNKDLFHWLPSCFVLVLIIVDKICINNIVIIIIKICIDNINIVIFESFNKLWIKKITFIQRKRKGSNKWEAIEKRIKEGSKMTKMIQLLWLFVYLATSLWLWF